MVDFILLGNSVRIALPVLQALHSASDARCAVVGSKDTLGLRKSSLCEQHALVDFAGDDDTVRTLNQLADISPHAILIPFDCEAVRLFNRIKDRLSLGSIPVSDLATLDMFDDKWAFHQFCLDSTLPVPLTRFIGDKSLLDFDALQADLGLPFIVKPTNASGSLGVQVVQDRDDFQQKIVDNTDYEFSTLIAQQFIEGVDVDINLLSVSGQLRALSIHRAGQACIDFMPSPELEAITQTLCQRSRYNGLMNVDVRQETSTGKFFLIESNPRFWASLASTIECGLNFAAESVKLAPPMTQPLRLTTGRSYTRHPFLRPSCWWRLALDRSEQGRLLRARAFDPYSLGELVQQLQSAFARLPQRGLQKIQGRRGAKVVTGP